MAWQGYRRYAVKGSGIILVGFALSTTSAIAARLTALLWQGIENDMSRTTFSLIVGALTLPGLVGFILLIYGMWALGKGWHSSTSLGDSP